jgi:hypothetical protein
MEVNLSNVTTLSVNETCGNNGKVIYTITANMIDGDEIALCRWRESDFDSINDQSISEVSEVVRESAYKSFEKLMKWIHDGASHTFRGDEWGVNE